MTGAYVELWLDAGTGLAATTTGTDGQFGFANVADGNQYIIKVKHDTATGVELGGCYSYPIVVEGQTTNVGDLAVRKLDLQLISPIGGEPVSSQTPTLSWQAYPLATTYKLFITDYYNAVFARYEGITSNSFVIPEALDPGQYMWGAYACNANGVKIASDTGRVSSFYIPPD